MPIFQFFWGSVKGRTLSCPVDPIGAKGKGRLHLQTDMSKLSMWPQAGHSWKPTFFPRVFGEKGRRPWGGPGGPEAPFLKIFELFPVSKKTENGQKRTKTDNALPSTILTSKNPIPFS